MDKLKMHSRDNIKEHIAQIAALFPNALTETIKDGKVTQAIDFDILKQELSEVVVDGPAERYQFTWPDKRKSILLANAPIAKTLRPSREESLDFDSTENLYIEGDNLDALKLLQETYLGKVKMIYIDPPYNTGNDFVYEDDFSQSEDDYMPGSGQFDESGGRLVPNLESNGRFHTDWLNMIYPRLKLAKDLLTEDGVIFISIDNSEVENLFKLGNEVFGEDNFVAIITLLCNPKGRSQDKYFATNHEFILVFSKTKLPKGSFSILKKDDQIIDEYPEQDENGKYRLLELRNTHREFGKFNRPNLFYPIFVNFVGEIQLNKDKEGLTKIFPIWEDGFEGCWTWDENKLIKDVDLVCGKKIKGQWKIYRKSYADGADKMLKTIFLDKEFYTEKGQKELNTFFESKGKVFQSPKSSALIKQLISTSTSNNDIVLDFFSGSATTADAVMQLNSEDAGGRKFVMVQLPEVTDEQSEAYKAGFKNICDIGKERIRRAGKKIKSDAGLLAKNLDTGFRVLKIDSTNMRDVYYTPGEYQKDFLSSLADNIKPDRSAEDLLFQVMLDLGILLSAKIKETRVGGKTVFDVAEGYLLACFDSNVTSDVVTEIAKRKPYYAIFRDSGIASDSVATNFDQIFATYSPTTVRKVL